jgi:hypothetical protein
MSSLWDDFWGAVTDLRHGTAKVTPLPGADEVAGTLKDGGAMSSLTDAVSFSKAVWLNVSDFRMWRSLGWIILGVIMMILGFVLWNRKAITAVASKVPL